jgi:SHS2 domain-containing protein
LGGKELLGHWEEIPHTADLAVRVWGETLQELYSAAGMGLADLLGEVDSDANATIRTIGLEALDAEALLVDWLNELLYLHETTQVVYTSFDFESLSPTSLCATVVGYPLAKRRAYIKAATYHNLAIERRSRGFEVVVVFDA